MKKIILLFTTICCLAISDAQLSGNPDHSFGNNGIVTARLAPSQQTDSKGIQVMSTPDGSMYVVIQSNDQTIISKRHSNGSLDVTYGNNGFSHIIDIEPTNAVLQADGKILVVGTTRFNSQDFVVARYNVDGILDSSFNGNGIQTIDFGTLYDDVYAAAVAIQSDGKIVLAGTANGNFAVTRSNTDGSIDNSFGDGGMQITFVGTSAGNAYALDIQADGKIVLAGRILTNIGGSDFALVRYSSDGNLDKTFSDDGEQITNFSFDGSDAFTNVANSIAIQKDGKLVVAGTAGINSQYFAVARYNINGTLDNSFGDGGKVTTDFLGDNYAKSVAIQKDGKIVVAGTTIAYFDDIQDFAIARYNSDGSLDNTFDKDGKITTDFETWEDEVNSVVLQPNGKIVAAGNMYAYYDQNFAVARYNTNGSLDNTFDDDGKLTGILKAGSTVFKSTAVQSDGKMVVAVITDTGNLIVRYKTNGSLDSTFGKNGILTTEILFSQLAIQKDGKIIGAGAMDKKEGKGEDIELARYTITGKADSSFGSGGIRIVNFGVYDSPSSIAIENDGKIIVAANTSFDKEGGNKDYDVALARFKQNGSFDSSFSGDGIIIKNFGFDHDYGDNNAVAIQKDNKVVIAGSTYLVRFDTNGNLDKNFAKKGIQTTDYRYHNSIAIQADGKILLSGYQFYDNSNLGLSRYNTDGSIDDSFSGDGKLNTPFYSQNANSIAIQTNGKIVASGGTLNGINHDFAFGRYNTDGSIDYSFGNNGIETTDILGTNDDLVSIAIANNKLYAIGNSQYEGSVGVVARYILATNEVPIVKITSPANNAQYTAPANITIKAAASDSGGTISYVKFYNGGTLLGTDSISPYTFTMHNVEPGNYSFVVKATTKSGLTASSANVAVTVTGSVAGNKAPVVYITSPVNNTAYTAPATITIKAAASDSDGTISYVKLYNGGTLLNTDSISPYTFTINSVAAGNYSLVAKATDNNGLTTSSASVAVIVAVPAATNKAPLVKITSPANNAVYTSPATITINAAASDSDGTISYVKLYNGGTLLNTDSTSPYTFTMKSVTAGNYSLVAKATDNKGLTTSSASVAVAVSAPTNTAPTVSITSPARNAVYYAPVTGGTITISASASDADGSIRNVRLYSGATLLTTDSTSPYNYILSNPTAGTYSFIAKATDNMGLFSSSSSVTITILDVPDIAPVVSMVSPANNAVYFTSAGILLNASATDADGISNVKFYSGATLLATDSISPYTYTLNNAAPGNYSFIAKATDKKGLFSSSSSVHVRVIANKAPEGSYSFSAKATDKNIFKSPDHLRAFVSPNPVAGNAKLILSTSSHLPVNLQLIDMLGRSYPSARFVIKGSDTFDFSVNDLPPGSYVIILKQGNLSTHARLIVAKK